MTPISLVNQSRQSLRPINCHLIIMPVGKMIIKKEAR
jgi:hypothetical protein